MLSSTARTSIVALSLVGILFVGYRALMSSDEVNGGEPIVSPSDRSGLPLGRNVEPTAGLPTLRGEVARHATPVSEFAPDHVPEAEGQRPALVLPGPVHTESDLKGMSLDFEAMYGGLERQELADVYRRLMSDSFDAEFINLHQDAYRRGDFKFIKDADVAEDGSMSFSLSPEQLSSIRPMFDYARNTSDGKVIKTTLRVEQLGDRAPIFAEIGWLHEQLK